MNSPAQTTLRRSSTHDTTKSNAVTAACIAQTMRRKARRSRPSSKDVPWIRSQPKAKLRRARGTSTRWVRTAHSSAKCEFRDVRVALFLCVVACGTITTPKTAASQWRGGITMGLGMALTEAALFDVRRGHIINPSLAEYHVPVNLDVPKIEIHFLDIPDPQTPMGAHGIGEIGITGVAAAVANAVFNATGRRIRDLPITLDKVL